MDRFRRLMESGYGGLQSSDARQIVRNSAEVTRYIEQNRGHLRYVQQLMNDKIIDEAMDRVRSRGDFEYDGDGTFIYKSNNRSNYTQTVNPNYGYQQPAYNQSNKSNNVMARLEAMEREMAEVRNENRELKSRYSILK